MAYIGREPQIGNFQVCDAISTVNDQAAYTMQVGGVNVSPETANHMLVSLNGILQAPTSSYTVSGSTITFASNLVTGDVINFIQILGSVLDLGVPSDSTVSIAKLSATGTKNSTTFLRGDNTFAAPSVAVASLSTASGSAPSYSARAWVNWDGDGSSGTDIRGSGNVSSITFNGTGDYRVNLATAMSDTNYSISGASGLTSNNNQTYFQMEQQTFGSTSTIDIAIRNESGSRINSKTISLQVFR